MAGSEVNADGLQVETLIRQKQKDSWSERRWGGEEGKRLQMLKPSVFCPILLLEARPSFTSITTTCAHTHAHAQV